MKFYGKAEQVTDKILAAFEAGKIPAALATVFIDKAGRPQDDWSPLNQMIAVLVGGTNDGRTFKAWKEVGRKVKKGAKAFNILAPCMRKGKKEFCFCFIGYGKNIMNIINTLNRPLIYLIKESRLCICIRR